MYVCPIRAWFSCALPASSWPSSFSHQGRVFLADERLQQLENQMSTILLGSRTYTWNPRKTQRENSSWATKKTHRPWFSSPALRSPWKYIFPQSWALTINKAQENHQGCPQCKQRIFSGHGAWISMDFRRGQIPWKPCRPTARLRSYPRTDEISQLICNTWKIAVLSMVLLDIRNIDGKKWNWMDLDIKKSCDCIHENICFPTVLEVCFHWNWFGCHICSSKGDSQHGDNHRKRDHEGVMMMCLGRFLSNHPDFEIWDMQSFCSLDLATTWVPRQQASEGTGRD